MAQTKKTPPEEEIEALKKRLKELEGCLPYAELQNLALNTMIDIAEEQGIQIRKKNGARTVTRLCERNGLNVKTACKLFGHCRQAYYQQKSDGEELLRRESRILSTIAGIRSVDPGIGGCKLWLMLCDLFGRGRMPGQDAFLKLLRVTGCSESLPAVGIPPTPTTVTTNGKTW